MDLVKAGFSFFKRAAGEDCPISPHGAKQLCESVAEIKKEQWRIKLLIFYIAGVMTVSEGDRFVEPILRVFGF